MTALAIAVLWAGLKKFDTACKKYYFNIYAKWTSTENGHAMVTNIAEHDKNLMVVAATEGYADRHDMPASAAFALLSKYGVADAIRQNYNTLHTQSLDECVYFAEDMLKWKME